MTGPQPLPNTPDSTLDSTPDSAPDTAPDSTPDSTPQATPDTAPGSTPDLPPDLALIAQLAPTSAPPGRQLPQGLRSFRHHNYRVFWTGMLISLLGTWMQQVGQAWLVLELTNDPVALGLVAAAQFTPVLIFGLFGGIVADAFSKRNALFVTQFAAGVLALILGILVVTGQVQVWHVFVLALGLGVVSAFDMPVRQAFVVEMVGRDDAANAVALNSAVFNLTRIVGPAIAGITIATVGLEPLFFINALSYVAMIVAMFLMRSDELHPLTERAILERNLRSVVDRLVEGLRYTRSNETIFVAITTLGIVSMFAMNFSVMVPLVARDLLGGDADTYGFLMSATGVGSFVSAISVAFGRRPTMLRLVLGAALVGLGMMGLGISRSLPLSLFLMFVAGWGVIAMAATCNTLIQLDVPDILRGRVASVYTTVFAGSTPFGGLFSGTVAAVGGTAAPLIIGGAVAVLAAGLGFLRIPGRGSMRELPIAERIRGTRAGQRRGV